MNDDDLTVSLRRRGFVKLPPDKFRLDDVTVEKLKHEFDRLFSGIYDTGVYPDEIHWRPGISKDNVTREICNAWKASPTISSVVCSPVLGRIASDLMGWNVVRIGQDDVIHKPPMSNAVGFHHDGAYISDNILPVEGNCLTMWIALDDADDENGALQYAPGSHLWPYRPVESVSASSFHSVQQSRGDDTGRTNNSDREDDDDVDDKYLDPLRQAAQLAGYNPETVVDSVETVCVGVGEMVVHHQQVWHGSGPNRSRARPRRALVAHVINGQVQWRTDPPPHYIYGRYFIRGETHLRDDFFPVLFSRVSDFKRTEWLASDAADI
jgi:phytanoyl-CoA hydroxylase